MKNIEYKSSGLKCDSPSCDWKDTTIKLEDLDKHLNMACPKCGENVLTEEDLNNAKRLNGIVEFINTMSPEQLEKFNSIVGKTPFDDLEEGVYDMTVETHKQIAITDIQKVENE